MLNLNIHNNTLPNNGRLACTVCYIYQTGMKLDISQIWAQKTRQQELNQKKHSELKKFKEMGNSNFQVEDEVGQLSF